VTDGIIRFDDCENTPTHTFTIFGNKEMISTWILGQQHNPWGYSYDDDNNSFLSMVKKRIGVCERCGVRCQCRKTFFYIRHWNWWKWVIFIWLWQVFFRLVQYLRVRLKALPKRGANSNWKTIQRLNTLPYFDTVPVTGTQPVTKKKSFNNIVARLSVLTLFKIDIVLLPLSSSFKNLPRLLMTLSKLALSIV